MIAFVALAAAALLSFGVLWLAALGVRERHALEPRRGPAPRLSLARFGLDAPLLGGGSLVAFAALETWIHCARRHAHALVAVPRGPRAPQCGADPARALARGGGAARRACATCSHGRAASCTCCGGCSSRAPRAGRSRSPRAASRRPPGCSPAPCARAGRPLSPFRSHATRGEK